MGRAGESVHREHWIGRRQPTDPADLIASPRRLEARAGAHLAASEAASDPSRQGRHRGSGPRRPPLPPPSSGNSDSTGDREAGTGRDSGAFAEYRRTILAAPSLGQARAEVDGIGANGDSHYFRTPGLTEKRALSPFSGPPGKW